MPRDGRTKNRPLALHHLVDTHNPGQEDAVIAASAKQDQGAAYRRARQTNRHPIDPSAP